MTLGEIITYDLEPWRGRWVVIDNNYGQNMVVLRNIMCTQHMAIRVDDSHAHVGTGALQWIAKQPCRHKTDMGVCFPCYAKTALKNDSQFF